MENILDVSNDIIYYCGENYAEFINNSYDNHIAANDIFLDVNRFQHILNEEQFFRKKDCGYAAAALISPSVKLKSIQGNDIQDIRTFIGKSGTSSSLHFDWNPCPILLYNTFGTKTFELSPPSSSRKFQGFYNFTLDKHFNLPFLVTIGPEEGILIPPLWWHRANYITDAKSISIRFKRDNSINYLCRFMYPSWKFLELTDTFKNEGSEFFPLELFKDVTPKNSSPLEYFIQIESILNKAIKFTDIDHKHYKSFSIDYLIHCIYKDLAV